MITVKYLLRLSICWAAVLVAPVATMAASITFNFTGVVTAVDSLLASEFSVSESVVGSYTFESTTPDSDPDPTQGIYDNAVTAFTATFGGDYTVTQGSDNDISVLDGLPGNDAYSVFLANPTAPTVAGLNVVALFLGLIDTDSTVFTSDALPLLPPSFSEFEDFTSGTIFLDDPNNRSVNFQLTSLTIIPEPSTFVLATLGLLGMGYRWKNRT